MITSNLQCKDYQKDQIQFLQAEVVQKSVTSGQRSPLEDRKQKKISSKATAAEASKVGGPHHKKTRSHHVVSQFNTGG